ncbi:MAG: transketolase [Candidatus Gottesmanbacteria bacterium]
MINYQTHAKTIRQNIIKMIADAKAAHIGGALSVVDILTVLYFDILKINPQRLKDPFRDRLIFSKGHAASALYATLAQRGFFSKRMLKTYFANGSKMPGHPVKNCVPGIEVSTGSLGHGLSMGLGIALSAKLDRQKYKTYVIMSEGDCDEGSTWEAAMMASHLYLDNLIAIIDYNKIQAFGKSTEVLNLEPLKDKWQAFGWGVREIDGHNYQEIEKVMKSVPFKKGKPNLIIAHTIKGKGISFMEDKLEWHYRYPDQLQLEKALAELK